MCGYNIGRQNRNRKHIWFFRIEPIDISMTLRDVFNSLSVYVGYKYLTKNI